LKKGTSTRQGVNDTSANWEALPRDIRVFDVIDLSDSDEDYYDFSNELLMRTMRERLLEALQIFWTDSLCIQYGYYVIVGNKFFATMNEQQQ
jgi:hypothetical protein